MPALPRRVFLARTGQAAIGLKLLSWPGCSRSPERDGSAANDSLAGLTSYLEANVPALLAAARVPGLSLALVSDGRVAWGRGFGVTDSVTQRAVSPDTLFEAGSVSKTVFAYAVMKLCEQGRLALDSPLVSYVADRWIDGDSRFGQITARHVLSHTSGLPNWRSNDDPLRIAFEPAHGGNTPARATAIFSWSSHPLPARLTGNPAKRCSMD